MGERKLEQINSALVNSFTTRKLQGDSDGSGKLAPKTVRDIDTILKSIHKYGENEYHTGPLAVNTVLPKNKKETVEALTVQEAAHIEAYLWQHQAEAKYHSCDIVIDKSIISRRHVHLQSESGQSKEVTDIRAIKLNSSFS